MFSSQKLKYFPLIVKVLICGLYSILSSQSTPPNILFIAVDDLKPKGTAYGIDIPTPAMDRLSAQGISFTNAHCQQAVCGPSRVSVMTGLLPDTTQVWKLNTKFRELNPGLLTLPEHFKANGYHTAGIGKIFDNRNINYDLENLHSWSEPFIYPWRVEFPDGIEEPVVHYHNPYTRALVESAHVRGVEGIEERKGLVQYLRKHNAYPAIEVANLPDEAYLDGAIALRAKQKLASLAELDKPFFYAVGFIRPHLPFVAPSKYWQMVDPEYIEIYPNQDLPKGAPEFAGHTSGELRGYSGVPQEGPIDEEIQRQLIHGYLASTAYVDAQIDKVLQELDALGLSENTIIVLWGDHGYHLGDHGLWNKHTNYEQSTRVPLIIAAPNGLTNQLVSQPVESTDIFPTLSELANLPIPPKLDGVSLAKTITSGAAVPREFAMSQFPREHVNAMGYTLRDGRYRYIAWFDTGEKQPAPATSDSPVLAVELYDYKTDPRELYNLANDSEYSDRIQRMHKSLLVLLENNP